MMRLPHFHIALPVEIDFCFGVLLSVYFATFISNDFAQYTRLVLTRCSADASSLRIIVLSLSSDLLIVWHSLIALR